MKNPTLATLGALAVAACGAGSEPSPASAPTTPLVIGTSPAPAASGAATAATAPAGAFGEKLAHARALRDEALALDIPVYRGDGGKQSRLAFMQTSVKTWFEKARPASERASEAYKEAFGVARAPQERALAASEGAEVETTFCSRFFAVSQQGEPDEWKSNAQIHETFQDAILQALAPLVQRAEATVDRCLKDGAPSSIEARRCAGLRGTLATMTPRPLGAAAGGTAPVAVPPATPGCACTPGDPMCSCGKKAATKPAPTKCSCPPADPLCSCTP